MIFSYKNTYVIIILNLHGFNDIWFNIVKNRFDQSTRKGTPFVFHMQFAFCVIHKCEKICLVLVSKQV